MYCKPNVKILILLQAILVLLLAAPQIFAAAPIYSRSGVTPQSGGNTQTYTLRGFIRDPSGVALPGTIIDVSGPRGTVRVTAGADGSYQVSGLALGDVRVMLYPAASQGPTSGASNATQMLSIIGNMSKDFTCTIPGTGTLHGFVRDAATGAAVQGATITVENRQTTTTRPDGGFSLSGIRLSHAGQGVQSHATVVITRQGYNRMQEDIAIREDTARDFVIVATGTTTQTYTLSGFIRDPSGVALPGTTIDVVSSSGPRHTGRGATAGADGSYQVSGLALGDVRITLHPAPSHGATSGASNAPPMLSIIGNMSKDFTYTIPWTGTLHGFVRDAATGAAVQGATITVDNRQTTATRPDGGFSLSGIRVPPAGQGQGVQGRATVVITRQGYNRMQEDIAIREDTARDFGIVATGTTAQTYTLSGFIRDPSGVALPGTTIVVSSGPRSTGRATAGADGSYQVSGLALGDVRITLHPAGATSGAGYDYPMLSIIGNMSKDFTYTIPGTGTLHGFVRDAATGAAVQGATITVDNRQTTATRPDGGFSLSGIRSPAGQGGANTVVITRQGYNRMQEGIGIRGDTAHDFGIVAVGQNSQ